jgi:rRNA-processing protein FCF1
MAPFLYHTDVLEELRDKMEGSYSIFIPSMVLTELAGIKGKRGRDAPNAAAAFKWLQKKIESHEVKLMLMTGSMDPWMLDFAAKKENKGKTVVCTNDVELRKSLKKKGVKVITMLGRKKLAFS